MTRQRVEFTPRRPRVLAKVAATCALLLGMLAVFVAPASASEPVFGDIDVECLQNGDIQITVNLTVSASANDGTVEVYADGVLIYSQSFFRGQTPFPVTVVHVVPGTTTEVTFTAQSVLVGLNQTEILDPSSQNPVVVSTVGACDASNTPEQNLVPQAGLNGTDVQLLVNGCLPGPATVTIGGVSAGVFTPDANGNINTTVPLPSGASGSTVSVDCGDVVEETTLVTSPSGPSDEEETPGGGAGSNGSGPSAPGQEPTATDGGSGSTTNSEVLGVSSTRTDTTTSVQAGGAGTLPRTGSNTMDMVRLAMLMVAGGGLILFGAQRLRERRTIDIG